MRFQSAQLIAYLSGGTWLKTAANSNARMAELATGLAKLGVDFANRPDVNMLFAYVDDKAADQLEAAGLLFYRMGRGTIRLVTSWQTTSEDIELALAAFESAC
jgi:threonine aldolase